MEEFRPSTPATHEYDQPEHEDDGSESDEEYDSDDNVSDSYETVAALPYSPVQSDSEETKAATVSIIPMVMLLYVQCAIYVAYR